jgi:hypothetical protein
MVADDPPIVLQPGQGKTVVFPGTFSSNRVTLLYGQSGSAYSIVEWVAVPGALDTPLHLYQITNEAFYVLEGTFGFEVASRL